ncbi:hypothetical protein HK405_007383 [Cladochytrium tenue]|nr:hypothetical protein HK405_007383 [Cladochytrium tenue]
MAFEAAVALALVLVLGFLVIACVSSVRLHAILRRRRRQLLDDRLAAIALSSASSAAAAHTAPELLDPLPLYEPAPPPHSQTGGDGASTDLRPAPIAADGLSDGDAALVASSSSSQDVLGGTTPHSTESTVTDLVDFDRGRATAVTVHAGGDTLMPPAYC